MLVLSRKLREAVVVGGGGGFPGLLKVTVLEIAIGRVKLGFEVDGAVPVYRMELWERMCSTSKSDGPAVVPSVHDVRSD